MAAIRVSVRSPGHAWVHVRVQLHARPLIMFARAFTDCSMQTYTHLQMHPHAIRARLHLQIIHVDMYVRMQVYLPVQGLHLLLAS